MILNINSLSGKIIGAAIEVHKALGPGLLESAYEECLSYKLGLGGLSLERDRSRCLFNIKVENLIVVTGWISLSKTRLYLN